MKLINIIQQKFLWLFGLENFMERNKNYYISPTKFYLCICFLVIFSIALVKAILNGKICFDRNFNFLSESCHEGVIFSGVSLWPVLLAVTLVILNLIFLIRSFLNPENNRVKYIFYAKILQVFACICFLIGVVLYLQQSV